jgi:predicted secreted protein
MKQITLIFALALVLSGGCSPAATKPSTPTASERTPEATSASIQSNAIGLTADDSGRTINAVSGQIIAIHLNSNPSTGYRWKAMADPDAKILKLNSSDYFPDTQTTLPGSGGIEIWVYQVIGAGSTFLRLGYFPPANPNQAASTFEITGLAK